MDIKDVTRKSGNTDLRITLQNINDKNTEVS